MNEGYARRRNYFIDRKFQGEFIARFCFIVIIASIFIGFLVLYLSRDFTTVTIENTKVMVKTAADFMLPIMVQTVIVVNLFAGLAVIILTLFTSHRIAGPLYRLKREIDLLKSGDMHANFRIRKTDQLQDLAVSLTDLAESLRDRHIALKDKALQIQNLVKTSPENTEAINARLKELEEILSQVKV